MRKSDKFFIFSLILMGTSGLIAQVVLLREILVTFYGNELSIGIILANWLILEALGAYIAGKKIRKSNWKIKKFIIIQFLFAVFLPLTVYLARILKPVIVTTPGEGIGIIPLFISTFFVLFPASFTHGALFSIGCEVYSSLNEKYRRSQDSGKSIGKVYVYETVGTLIGGILFTYLLIPYFNSFQIVIGVSLLNLILCTILSNFKFKSLLKNANFLSSKMLKIVSLVFLSIFLIALFNVNKISDYSIDRQWGEQNVIFHTDTKYQNLVVTKLEGEYTFFSNGVPYITVPNPNITSIESFSHFALLSHPDPKKILVISGGAGGIIREILKYPVERIDYLELDPELLKTVEKISVPLTEKELNSNRVNVIFKDGRLFVKSTDRKYDVILIGISLPTDLQENRLFTQEFFSLARKHLTENGVLMLSLPGSLSYLSKELKKVNACIYKTIYSVFPFLRVIPGDTNYFLASLNKKIEDISSSKLINRLKNRNIKVQSLVPDYIKYRLDSKWQNWFLQQIKNIKVNLNRDFKPIEVFYSLSYWNTLFSPYLDNFFSWIEKSIWNSLIFLIVIFIIVFFFFSFLEKFLHSFSVNNHVFSKTSISYVIVTTGFVGMIFDIALIFIFQSFYGYVYSWVGMLIAIFMVGTTVGSSYIIFKLEKLKDHFKSLIRIEVAIIIFTFLVPIIFSLTKPYLVEYNEILKFIFITLCFMAGIAVGLEFPLANKLHLDYVRKKQSFSEEVGSTAGLLYSADLIGGWIGGIVGGVILLPILGLIGTCILLIGIKISSLFIFYNFRV